MQNSVYELSEKMESDTTPAVPLSLLNQNSKYY